MISKLELCYLCSQCQEAFLSFSCRDESLAASPSLFDPRSTKAELDSFDCLASLAGLSFTSFSTIFLGTSFEIIIQLSEEIQSSPNQ